MNRGFETPQAGPRDPLTALAEAREGEPFELEVELGGVPDEVARWLNPRRLPHPPLRLRSSRGPARRIPPPSGGDRLNVLPVRRPGAVEPSSTRGEPCRSSHRELVPPGSTSTASGIGSNSRKGEPRARSASRGARGRAPRARGRARRRPRRGRPLAEPGRPPCAVQRVMCLGTHRLPPAHRPNRGAGRFRACCSDSSSASRPTSSWSRPASREAPAPATSRAPGLRRATRRGSSPPRDQGCRERCSEEAASP